MAARIERLAMSDLMMLIPDDFGWPQDIGAIGILELPPRETVDTLLFRVRNVIASRLHLVPRFRQVIETPPIAFGVPYWRDDSSFDIVDHVRIHELPSGSTDDDLRACFEVLRARRFVMSRPLWEVWLVPGLARGRVGLIVKVHHALADGMSALAQVMTFLDVSSTSATQSPRPWTPAVAPTKGALLVDNVRQRSFQVCRLLLQLLRPWRIFGAYRRWSALLHEVLGREDAPATSLQRPIGPNRRISVVRTALADIKVIAHANDAKVNDVLLSLMASGARALMQSRGERVDGVVLRASVPIAQHANRAEAKGNQDGGMLVELPIGGELDERQRLRAIARDTEMRKQQPRPTFNVPAFPGSLTLMRRFMRGMRTQRLANLYAANIIGPPMDMYLAGARLVELVPVVPINGNITIGVGALSYAGHFNIGMVADADACPDLDVFADGVRGAFTALVETSQAARGFDGASVPIPTAAERAALAASSPSSA